jgi:uncharacterized membrane protein YfcA
MTLDPQVTQYALMALVLAAAALLQGTVGFAYALLATPLLTCIGIPLPQTLATVATASLVQCVVGVRQLGPDVPWSSVLSGTLVRYAGTLAGSLVLLSIVALPKDELRLVVGCVVVAIVLTQLALRVRPAAKLHPAWAWVAFSTSGLLAGLTGMGGPPLVMWATAHDWPMRRVRGFLFAMFAFALPFQLLLLWLLFPSDTLCGMRDGFYLTPLVLLSSLAGVWLGNRVPGDWLRAAIYGVLIATAAGLVVPALTSLLR